MKIAQILLTGNFEERRNLTMKAPPPGLNPKAFFAHINDHVDRKYQPNDQHGYVCRKCKSVIKQTTCFVSVHAAGDTHAGWGEVKTARLPYCPTCEGEPTEKDVSTCVHVPLVEALALPAA